MAKSREAFRTISEVADWLSVQTHVLRFWESKFSQVKPVKRAGGRRYYRPQDMELLGGIKKLLHEDGMSIKDVQALLRDKGVKHVSDLSQPIDQNEQKSSHETTDPANDVIDGTSADGEGLQDPTHSEPTPIEANQDIEIPSEPLENLTADSEMSASADSMELPADTTGSQPQDGPLAEISSTAPDADLPQEANNGADSSTPDIAPSETAPAAEMTDLFAALEPSSEPASPGPLPQEPLPTPSTLASAPSAGEDTGAAPLAPHPDSSEALANAGVDQDQSDDALDLPQFLSAAAARALSEGTASDSPSEADIGVDPDTTAADAGDAEYALPHDSADDDLSPMSADLPSPQNMDDTETLRDSTPAAPSETAPLASPASATADPMPPHSATSDSSDPAPPEMAPPSTSNAAAVHTEEQSKAQESTKDAFFSALVVPQSIAPANRDKAAALLDRLAALHAQAS